jgi:hypothetical protein
MIRFGERLAKPLFRPSHFALLACPDRFFVPGILRGSINPEMAAVHPAATRLQ